MPLQSHGFFFIAEHRRPQIVIRSLEGIAHHPGDG
jgi:hypothetical protein